MRTTRNLIAILQIYIFITLPIFQGCKKSKTYARVKNYESQANYLAKDIKSKMEEIHRRVTAAGFKEQLPEEMQEIFTQLLNDDYMANLQKTLAVLMDKENLAPFEDEETYPEGFSLYQSYISDLETLRINLIHQLRDNPKVIKVDESKAYGDDSRYKLKMKMNELLEYLFISENGYLNDPAIANSTRAERQQFLSDIEPLFEEIAIKEAELSRYKADVTISHQEQLYGATSKVTLSNEKLASYIAKGQISEEDQIHLQDYKDHLHSVLFPYLAKIKYETSVKIDRMPGTLSLKQREIKAYRYFQESENNTRELIYNLLAVEAKLKGLSAGAFKGSKSFRLAKMQDGKIWKMMVEMIREQPLILTLLIRHLKSLLLKPENVGFAEVRVILFSLFGLNLDHQKYLANRQSYKPVKGEKSLFQSLAGPNAEQFADVQRTLSEVFQPVSTSDQSLGKIISQKMVKLPYVTGRVDTEIDLLLAKGTNLKTDQLISLFNLIKVVFLTDIPAFNQESKKPFPHNVFANKTVINIFNEALFYAYQYGNLKEEPYSQRMAFFTSYLTSLQSNLFSYLPLITHNTAGQLTEQQTETVFAIFESVSSRISELFLSIQGEVALKFPVRAQEGKIYIDEATKYAAEMVQEFSKGPNNDDERLYKFLSGFPYKALYKETVPFKLDEAERLAIYKIMYPGGDLKAAKEDFDKAKALKVGDPETSILRDFALMKVKYSMMRILIEASRPGIEQNKEALDDAFKEFKTEIIAALCMIKGLPDDEGKGLLAVYQDIFSYATSELAYLNLSHWFRKKSYSDLLDVVARFVLVKEERSYMQGSEKAHLVAQGGAEASDGDEEEEGPKGLYLFFSLRKDTEENPIFKETEKNPRFNMLISQMLMQFNQLSAYVQHLKDSVKDQQTALSLDFDEILRHMHIAPRKVDASNDRAPSLPMPSKQFLDELNALFELTIQSGKDFDEWQKNHPGSMDTCGPYKAGRKLMDAWYAFAVRYNYEGDDIAVQHKRKSRRFDIHLEGKGTVLKPGTGPYVFDPGEFMWGLFGNNPCSDIEDYELPELSPHWKPKIYGDDGVFMPFLANIASGEKDETKKDKAKIFVPLGTKENNCLPVLDPETNTWSINGKHCPKFFLPKLHEYVWEGAENGPKYVSTLLMNVAVLAVVIMMTNMMMGALIMPFAAEFFWLRFIAQTFINPLFFTVNHNIVNLAGRSMFADKYGESKQFMEVHWNHFGQEYIHNIIIFGILHATGHVVQSIYPKTLKYYLGIRGSAGGKAIAGVPAAEATGEAIAKSTASVPQNVLMARVLERALPVLGNPMFMQVTNTVTGAFALSVEAKWVSPMFMIYQTEMEKAEKEGKEITWSFLMGEFFNFDRPEFALSTFTRLFLDNLAFFGAMMAQGPLMRAGSWTTGKVKQGLGIKPKQPSWQRKEGNMARFLQRINLPGKFKRKQLIAELETLDLIHRGQKQPGEVAKGEAYERLKTQSEVYHEIREKYAKQGISAEVGVHGFETKFLEHMAKEVRLQYSLDRIESLNFSKGEFLNLDMENPQVKKALSCYKGKLDQMAHIMILQYMRARQILVRTPEYNKALSMQDVMALSGFVSTPYGQKAVAKHTEAELKEAFDNFKKPKQEAEMPLKPDGTPITPEEMEQALKQLSQQLEMEANGKQPSMGDKLPGVNDK